MYSLEPESDVRKTAMTSHVLALVAERFKVLGEPTRLEILNALRSGERTVTQLIADTGLGQANLSKHLQLLHGQGFVARRKEGVNVYYALADQSVFRLCDIMCDRIGRQAASRRRLLAS